MTKCIYLCNIFRANYSFDFFNLEHYSLYIYSHSINRLQIWKSQVWKQFKTHTKKSTWPNANYVRKVWPTRVTIVMQPICMHNSQNQIVTSSFCFKYESCIVMPPLIVVSCDSS